MDIKSFGGIAFLVGLVLAAIVAVISGSAPPTWAVAVMAVLGVVVGVLNVQDKEIMMFLIAALTFMLSFNSLSQVFTAVTFGWAGVSTFFSLMSVFVAPAAAIVAGKALLALAKD